MELFEHFTKSSRLYTFLSVIPLLYAQLRPKQWTKNLLVFAAFLFTFPNITAEMFIKSIIGFLLFSFVSGCVYILNDFVDIEADRQHPEKKERPMASGRLSPRIALSFGTLLWVFSTLLAFMFNPQFGLLLLAYFAINVAYSLKLKHIVLIDVMIIAAGFVLRAIGGALIIRVPFTPWFLLVAMFLALFLAISKRRQELFLLQNGKGEHRKVLEYYTPELLNQLNNIVTSATITSYALFSFTSGRTLYLMWTIPFVIYGIFRYLYLLHVEGKGGSPDKVLLEDKHILFTVLLYALTVIIILSVFE